MTPIRALFFLAAITAACAGRIPAQVEDTSSLKTQIALLSHQRLTGNPVETAIEKFKELVRRIKERVHQLENVLVDALQASSAAVAEKINEFILKRTGIDLNLEGRLEALEEKTEACNAAFKTNLNDVILEIKTETETCAATQIAEALDIRAQVRALLKVLEVVPAQTIRNIKACGAAPTTAAPATEAPETEAPETEAPETEAPETEAPETEAPETEAPETEAPDTEAPETPEAPETVAPATESSAIPDSGVAVRGHHAVGSWSDAWRKAKCVSKELAAAARELSEVPDLVAKLVSDAADLYNKETRDTLKKCALQGISGKGERVQLAAAQLAYCVIAPSQQQ